MCLGGQGPVGTSHDTTVSVPQCPKALQCTRWEILGWGKVCIMFSDLGRYPTLSAAQHARVGAGSLMLTLCGSVSARVPTLSTLSTEHGGRSLRQDSAGIGRAWG